MFKNLKTLIFSILTVFYLEIIFALAVFHELTTSIIYIFLFSVPIGIILYLVSGLFKNKINKIIYAILVFCTFIIY